MLYDEMFEWLYTPAAAPASLTSEHLGTTFRKFLRKYPEANLIYSKMIYVSILVNQIRGDRYKKKAAKEELWRGQCNVVYWHGNFDGIYSNHLRKKVYGALLEAEKLTRVDGVFMPSIITTDFDTDGRNEFLYQGNKLNAYIHTTGGMLFELDYLPASWNYLDTMSRYREPYHDDVARDNHYDQYLRRAFLDHFFSKETNPGSFKKMQYQEAGDFIGGEYLLEKLDKNTCELSLVREGCLTQGGQRYPLRLAKTYLFSEYRIKLKYKLTNLSSGPLDTRFAVENNFALPTGGPANYNILELKDSQLELTHEAITESALQELTLKDLKHKVRLQLSASRPADLWGFPIETYSRTLHKLNKIYQSSCFVLVWPLQLAADEEWELELGLELRRSK